ncbi:hypothetical protein AZE42_09341 [Rhizopogon vesiculosus]|uniref:DUF6699 domain-containing protein n=1 Tax=Rhizopogon vesiculosus TaxID=180088 RepID=A0A1J8PTR0_9AGAM|nr:hypothetical protein AZE42_09341 [Rhizopogon vesiculosus]
MTRTHTVRLNPLFTSSPAGERYYMPVPIQWDVRYAPEYSAQLAAGMPLSPSFSQFATTPPLPKLHLVCDLLFPDWEIVAHNPTGVTVGDVVEAIYETLHKRLAMHEWERLSFKQRERIEDVFRARCMTSSNPERALSGCIRRADYLLTTTMFAGLTSLVRRGREWQVVLTLSRDFRRVATFAR